MNNFHRDKNIRINLFKNNDAILSETAHIIKYIYAKSEVND